MPMVVLPFRKMVPPVEAHSLPQCSSLRSSWYECHLLGDEHGLYKLYIIFIYMYVFVCVYIHIRCLCICLFTYGSMAFSWRCSWVKLRNLAMTWSFSLSEDLPQLVFCETQIALGFYIARTEARFWYCWCLMLPSLYWKQLGIFSCIAHCSWCGKLSQLSQWSDSKLGRYSCRPEMETWQTKLNFVLFIT